MIYIHTIKQITNENLMYSTRNSTFYEDLNGKAIQKKRGHVGVYIYIADSLWCTEEIGKIL